MPDNKHMDIAEFRAAGYLQEINRRFLHPLGLALCVKVDADGTEQISGIWDCRDDPEGIAYGPDVDLTEHAHAIDQLWQAREAGRRAGLGFMVQPAAEQAREDTP